MAPDKTSDGTMILTYKLLHIKIKTIHQSLVPSDQDVSGCDAYLQFVICLPHSPAIAFFPSQLREGQRLAYSANRDCVPSRCEIAFVWIIE